MTITTHKTGIQALSERLSRHGISQTGDVERDIWAAILHGLVNDVQSKIDDDSRDYHDLYGARDYLERLIAEVPTPSSASGE